MLGDFMPKLRVSLPRSSKFSICLSLGLLAGLALTLIGGNFLLKQDFHFFMRFFLSALTLGLSCFPLSSLLFRKTPELSLLFSLPLGLALNTFVVWSLAYLKLAPFNLVTIQLVCVTLLVLNLIFSRTRLAAKKSITTSQNWPYFLFTLWLFIACYLYMGFVRGTTPDARGLEKFMNIGFMSSMWRSETLPAMDMWFSREPINYYYYGQYVYTFLGKMTQLAPNYTYNFGFAACFAYFCSGSFGIGALLFMTFKKRGHQLGNKQEAQRLLKTSSAGFLSLFFASIAGNSHDFFVGPQAPFRFVLEWLDRGRGKFGDLMMYSFSNATRYIGYNPDTTDKTIHEFPYYSFLVADLHAHVTNTVFVLLFIALLIVLLREVRVPSFARQLRPIQKPNQQAKLPLLAQATLTFFKSPLPLFSLLLSIFMVGNYWDFAIYFVVLIAFLFYLQKRACGALSEHWLFFPLAIVQVLPLLIAFLKIQQSGLQLLGFALSLGLAASIFWLTPSFFTLYGLQANLVFTLTHLLALPFNLYFVPISKKIALVKQRTPFWQLFVLYGPQALIALSYVAICLILFASLRRRQLRLQQQVWANFDLSSKKLVPKTQRQKPGFFRLLTLGDYALLLCLVCGFGLILVPELVYVVDIYGGSYARANTMFKFAYQAHILIGLALPLSVWRFFVLVSHLPKPTTILSKFRLATLTIAGALSFCLLVAPSCYPFIATSQWLPKQTLDAYRTQHGTYWMTSKDSDSIQKEGLDKSMKYDYALTEWINQNLPGQPTVLEAAGKSYTDANRISAYTGVLNVLGWETHEWLWRSSAEQPDAYGQIVRPRQEAISQIYQAKDRAELRRLLQQYKVDYIVIANIERSAYPELNEALLRQAGEVVFEEGPTALIKVQ